MSTLQDHQIGWDVIGDYVVSTISLNRPEVRALDSLVGVFSAVVEATGADLPDRPGAATDPTQFQYESMVFKQSGGEILDWSELDCKRYQTEDEAHKGHAALVKEWASKE